MYAKATSTPVAPAFSIGNAVADVRTIPAAARKQLTVKVPGGPQQALDVVRFLAAYEEKRPNYFAMRDEVIRFKDAGNGRYRARIAHTPVPGVYRMGISVMGTVLRPDGRLDRIARILNTEIALGIRLSAEHSRPTLFWLTPKKFVVVLTPRDAQGNIPLLDPRSSLAIRYRRSPLAFTHHMTKNGMHALEVEIDGAKVDDSGTCLLGHAVLSGVGAKLRLSKDAPLALTVELGATSLPVLIPARIATKGGAEHAAGSAAAMQLPVEHRIAAQQHA